MITTGILYVFKGLLTVLLAPLSVINITIDFLSSFPALVGFFQVVAYLFPWQYILPLIIFVGTIFSFRIIISIILLVLKFIPFE